MVQFGFLLKFAGTSWPPELILSSFHRRQRTSDRILRLSTESTAGKTWTDVKDYLQAWGTTLCASSGNGSSLLFQSVECY